MRSLSFIIAFAITALVSAAAGADAFDRVSAHEPSVMADAMDAACPRCSDHAMPDAHPDHRNCGDCVSCALLFAIEPEAEAGSPLEVSAAVAVAGQSPSPGNLDPYDPPPPRV